MSSPGANTIDALALQDAIGTLIADNIGEIEGVIAAPDNSVAYPYVTLGEDEEADASTQCVAGSDIFFPIHVWTKEKGWTQNKRICCDIRSLLNEAEIVVSGHVVKSIYFRRARRIPDPELGIRHGVMEFDVWIEAVP